MADDRNLQGGSVQEEPTGQAVENEAQDVASGTGSSNEEPDGRGWEERFQGDPQKMWEAYRNLEREFTRTKQRLSELEKQGQQNANEQGEDEWSSLFSRLGIGDNQQNLMTQQQFNPFATPGDPIARTLVYELYRNQEAQELLNKYPGLDREKHIPQLRQVADQYGLTLEQALAITVWPRVQEALRAAAQSGREQAYSTIQEKQAGRAEGGLPRNPHGEAEDESRRIAEEIVRASRSTRLLGG